jgi:hypothetical protein
VDTIKALKEIRDITMNRLTPIHKEIYDIADTAISKASAGGCTTGCLINTQVGGDHRYCECPCHKHPASPPKDGPCVCGHAAHPNGSCGILFCDCKVYRPAPAQHSGRDWTKTADIANGETARAQGEFVEELNKVKEE